MPLPLILGVGAAIAGVAGVGSGIHGAAKMKEASDTMQSADSRHKRNLSIFERQSAKTNTDMDELGKMELEILKSFEDFSNMIEKIQNRPQFKKYEKNGVSIPEYNGEKLKEVSVGAGVLLGGIGGAAAGTAGGFAAAGATTAAVMALGTASTGTAIASLSGAAATNATLAALGGGAIAAGGGGIALGTTILGAATLGVGLLVGGVIFSVTGSSLSDKADEAWRQMERAEKEINRICDYMNELSGAANQYKRALSAVKTTYMTHLGKLKTIVNVAHKTNWLEFSDNEKLLTENTVLLVGLLYNMCKVELVQKAPNENELNIINHEGIYKAIGDSSSVLNGMKKATIDLKISEISKNAQEITLDDFAELCILNNAVVNELKSGSSEARSWCTKNADLPRKTEKEVLEAGKGKPVSYYGKARAGMICAFAAVRSIVTGDENGFKTWSREYRLLETSIRFFFGKTRYVNYNDFTDSEVPFLQDYLDFDNPYGNIITNEILEEVFCKVQGNNPLFRLEVEIEKNKFSINRII